MRVIISGTEYLVVKNKTNIEDAIGERSIASFVVIDIHSEFTFTKGMPVTIYDDDDNDIYKGFVNDVKEQRDGLVLYHSIDVVDNHYLADKRTIAKAYASEYAGDIVKDIIAEKLAEEDITEGCIEQGPVITEAVFNYVSCADAISELADKAGFWWKIDRDRQLHFRAKTSVDSPFDVTPKDFIGKPRVTIENNSYRNTQIIRGSKDLTDVLTEYKTGDGQNKTFTVGFPIAKVPTITLNDVPQTVGIKGLESGKDWYWNKGDPVITQDNDATPLKPTDTLKIEYQGEYDIIVFVNDLAEIAQRADIEETSGIVEHVEDQPNITSLGAAFEVANKLLEQNKGVNKKIQFATYKPGLQAGQLLTVTVPYHKLFGEKFLITMVTATRDGNRFIYDITAVQGPGYKPWQELFANMFKKPEKLLVRKGIQEQQILVTVEDFERTWEETDHPNIFKEVYASENLFPSEDLYPMFEPSDRVKYVAWFNGGTELGRKQVTKTVATDGQIDTITYLASYEANTTITHLGFIGGWRATAEIGTGILTDLQAFDKTKTQLESIQINKTDIRDFTPDEGDFAITAEYMQYLDDLITELEEMAA